MAEKAKTDQTGKLSVRVTLNPNNPFEARLIQRLQHEKNKAGALKVLAYERLVIDSLQLTAAAATKAEPDAIHDTPSVDMSGGGNHLHREIGDKVDRMFDNF